SRAERRCAVDVSVAVRSPDGRTAHHRAGDRAQHLSRTGGAPRVGEVEGELQRPKPKAPTPKAQKPKPKAQIATGPSPRVRIPMTTSPVPARKLRAVGRV